MFIGFDGGGVGDNMKIKNITNLVLYLWVWLGKRLGFTFVDIYASKHKGGKAIGAVTFSKSEWYINKVSEIER